MKREINRTTFIYGLIDPRNQQLRYIGKTVLLPHRRLFTHQWRARAQPHKRHSMAWLLSLERLGLVPEIIVIEEVLPGGDWVEAEQFWIGYFKMIGADLCNHTIGGEGQTGHKQSPRTIAKRIKYGAEHHGFGKPQHPNAKSALKIANEKLRADPVRWKMACDNRKAAFTEEMKQKRISNLQTRMADPELRAQANKKRAEIARRPENRAAVSQWSKSNWKAKRDQIIASQNAGKGDEWKRRQSDVGRRRMSATDHPLRLACFKRRKLTDSDVVAIRHRVAAGERVGALAKAYGVDTSTISHIKSGRDR